MCWLFRQPLQISMSAVQEKVASSLMAKETQQHANHILESTLVQAAGQRNDYC